MEQLVARRAHNPKVVRSSRAPATKKKSAVTKVTALFLFPSILALQLTLYYDALFLAGVWKVRAKKIAKRFEFFLIGNKLNYANLAQAFTSEANRMVFLFELYEKYTANLFTKEKVKKK